MTSHHRAAASALAAMLVPSCLLAAPASAAAQSTRVEPRATTGECAAGGDDGRDLEFFGASTRAAKSSVGSSVHLSRDGEGGGSYRITWSEGRCSIEMRSIGEVRFAPDLTDVDHITPGGSIQLSERVGGRLRVLRIGAQGDGTLERKWWVDGIECDYDDAARAWFGALALDLDRRTGFASETRVPAILQRAGVDGILREAAQMPSDVARGRYFLVAIKTGRLTSADARTVLRTVGRDIGSDVELARFLTAAAEHGLARGQAAAAFFDALGSVESDVERARVLTTMLKTMPTDRALLLDILHSARDIDSDVEATRVLVEFARVNPAMDDELRSSYVNAAQQIESDVERKKVLSPLVVRTTF